MVVEVVVVVVVATVYIYMVSEEWWLVVCGECGGGREPGVGMMGTSRRSLKTPPWSSLCMHMCLQAKKKNGLSLVVMLQKKRLGRCAISSWGW